MKLSRLFLLAPLGVVLASSAARGAASPTVRTLDVEIVDTTKAGTDTTRFSLAIDGPKPTKLSVPAGDLSYQLDARCDATPSGSVPISIGVHRVDYRPGSPLRIDADLAVSVPAFVRTVVASAARPDGSKVEIAVRVH